MVKVIHIKDADFSDPATVYIGRAGKGKPGSPLANPYRLTQEDQRADVLRRYEFWLWTALTDGTPQMEELQRLIKLYRQHGKLNLVCFCAPKPCHGDFIKLAIESGVYE